MSITNSIENIFYAIGRYWGGLNSSLYNNGSIWGIKTGIESADLNMAWNEKPLTVNDSKAIQDVKNYFRRAGLPFWWWVFPGGQSPDIGSVLKEGGFSFTASVPCLLADLTILADERCDASLQIRQITNKKELFLWEEVSFAGFDFPPETRQQYHRFVGTFNLSQNSPQKFFLALRNGKPVATSLLFLQENTGGIYFVSTLVPFRKKGVGLSVTLATMSFARQSGARFVALQSTTDGLRVYQQAGFQEYCRADVYCLAT